jgi:predicted transcriptional regulator
LCNQLLRDRAKEVYRCGMPFRTTAFKAADALGWNMEELARRSGVPSSTLYEIRRGRRFVGPKSMPGLRRAFPHLSFEQLFVSTDSATAELASTRAEAAA